MSDSPPLMMVGCGFSSPTLGVFSDIVAAWRGEGALPFLLYVAGMWGLPLWMAQADPQCMYSGVRRALYTAPSLEVMYFLPH